MTEKGWKDKHGRPEIIAGEMFRGAPAPMVRFTDADKDAAANNPNTDNASS
jgi:hypothetical protein